MREVNQTVQPEICYIGLGSNLNSPIEQINKAIHRLAKSSQIKLIKTSSLYKSPPMGPQDQNDYINAVVEIETDLSSLALLDRLQSIELSQGRIRKEERWGARTLDLDLLLYGNQMIDNERLTVPHYGLTDRAFVLYPLFEIASELKLPKGQDLVSIIKQQWQLKPTIEKLKASIKSNVHKETDFK
jgi:2-amino-4-hydroxy-6-hydroxymethyldihydropteridine diphosphokinase